MIRILLLAPTPVGRAGWRALLAAEAQGDLEVVAEAAESAELAAAIAASQPDVVLLDPAPDDEALAPILQALTHARPGLRAIVLGGPGDAATTEALRAGARGYLRLAATGPEVAAAVRAVARGLVVLDPANAGPLLDRLAGQQTAPLPPPVAAAALTPRELQVLQLLAAGLTNRGIARQLRISEHTAKFHVGALLTKLGASSRAEAVALAARHGLILV